MSSSANLAAGDPAPWFYARTLSNPRYAFHSCGGRYLVLCFFGSTTSPGAKRRLKAALARRDLFNDVTASFFGVSIDSRDESEKRLADALPGYRHFLDFNRMISTIYGALPGNADPREELTYQRKWVVLDPTLRVMRVINFAPDESDREELLAYVERLPSPDSFAGIPLQAPILFLPNVFEPEFCRELIDLYKRGGGQDSGFMREVGGKTVTVTDHRFKRRKDHEISDGAVIHAIQERFGRRVLPEVYKAYRYKATRMERYIVACYAAEDAAHFNAHRDNTTKGTAHRQFAVSVNLSDDFDGGEVSFPEYGPRGYKAPAGGAVVFSCSLLHAVSTVTRGTRYAFLPFLYDDQAAELRKTNNAYLGDNVRAYQAAG